MQTSRSHTRNSRLLSSYDQMCTYDYANYALVAANASFATKLLNHHYYFQTGGEGGWMKCSENESAEQNIGY